MVWVITQYFIFSNILRQISHQISDFIDFIEMAFKNIISLNLLLYYQLS